MSNFKVSVICITILLIFAGYIGKWVYTDHVELEKYKIEKDNDYAMAKLLSNSKVKRGTIIGFAD